MFRNGLNRVYTICHSQQSDQGLHYLPFSAICSEFTLFGILSSLIRVYTICLLSLIRVYTICLAQQSGHIYLAVLWRSTLFATLSSLIRVYTICHFQQSEKVYTVILSSLIRVYNICHSQQSDKCQCPLSASEKVWSVSTLFAILSRLIDTFCHSQSDQGLHYLPFSVWKGSRLYAIISSLIRVYTTCHSL